MPKTSKGMAPEHVEGEGFEGHYDEVGPYTIGFERYTADADMAPLFRGLPDDRCQSRHWGVVLKGKLAYTTASGTEEITTGEAYYVGPGHTPTIYAGTEVIEFSPTDEFTATMEVVGKNMESAG